MNQKMAKYNIFDQFDCFEPLKPSDEQQELIRLLHHISSDVLNYFRLAMEMTPQSKKYHKEGDVHIHTMMVNTCLEANSTFISLDTIKEYILRIASLLHDIGKTVTTINDNGEWKSPNHAPVGSRMARELLWKEYGLCGTPEKIAIREAICLLIRYHSLPPYAVETDDIIRKLHALALNGNLTKYFTLEMLHILSKADMEGRTCDDMDEIICQVDLFRALAEDEQCLTGAYPFKSDVAKRMMMQGKEVWKDDDPFDETWGEVVLMCGLPGTGKDTWIANNLKGMPMISLDEIRKEKGISPSDKQGEVVQAAREKAKEYLRKHVPFVWNATNVTRQMRDSLVSLFEDYGASVRIVYLETEWKNLLDRNKSRKDVVPVSAIEGMLTKMTLPEASEARKVEWITI